jgi:hypothetical protein
MRPMDQDMIATHLKKLDRRLAKVEQILPTLATKAELQMAVAPLATKEEVQAAIAPLATKEELQAAIAPLATKEELQAAITPLATKDDLVELRRHMDVLTESLRGDIHLIAAHVASERSKHPGT